MKKSRFTESQIVRFSKKEKRASRWPSSRVNMESARRPTITGKSKYGGAGVSELKRLRELEAENAKLKRMYADLALENTAIKDVLSRKL